MSKQRRYRFLVDPGFQIRFLARAVRCRFYCLFTAMLFTVCWIVFALRPSSSIEMVQQIKMNCGPALAGSVLLLPLVSMDGLRMRNRVAGPVHRLKAALQQVNDDEIPDKIRLRKDDRVEPLVDEFNAAVPKLRDQQFIHPRN